MNTRIYSAVLAALIPLLLGLLTLPAHAGTVTAQPSSRTVVLTGFTRARATLDLVAEESGRVLNVKADIGDAIGASGVFASIDRTFIRLDLEGNRVNQGKLASRIAYDENEARRYRELVSRETAAQSTLDKLEQTLDANRHELAALKVSEQVLMERLKRTTIPAPKGWRVTARDIEPGQWVAKGQAVGRAGDFSTLLAPFALTPEQFEVLRSPPAPRTVRLTDLGRDVNARIYRANPAFDPATRKIAVELALSGMGDDALMRGGLRVRLELPMPEETGAVLLPRAAIEERYEENWVTRANGERIRVVVLGNHGGPDGSLLRVAGDGIKPGDAFTTAED